MIAIIGGTGVHLNFEQLEHKVIQTPYGVVELDLVLMQQKKVVLLPRHGVGHKIPPHKISYKANIHALHSLGVTHIFSTATVGSLQSKLTPGSIVVLSDFIDQTSQREHTFFDGDDGVVAHVDMGDPYCSNLRSKFLNIAQQSNVDVVTEGVYVCTDGPRFETKSEIQLYQQMNGTVVGMTNVPEVILAKELGICYFTVGLVSNMAQGLNDELLVEHDISTKINLATEQTLHIFQEMIKETLDQNHCYCASALLKL